MARSITRHGAGENGDTVKDSQAVSETPAAVRARAPVDLIAQEKGHRDPEQTGNDQQISEESYENPGRFSLKKCRIEERLGGKQE